MAVGGWRPCGAGLILGLQFYRGLGAIHISRKAAGGMDGQKERLTDRQTDRHSGRQADSKPDIQTDRQI
jgi:hypothetical protein